MKFKKMLSVVLSSAMVMGMLAGCGSSAPTDTSSSGTDSATTTTTSSASADTSSSEAKGTINLWTFTDEVPGMVEKFLEANPDFGYEVNSTIIATTDGAYQPALDQALAGGGKDAPDMYCAESAFVLKYSQGDASGFAAAYKDLGIDIDKAIADANIAQYSVDIGTNGNGDVVGLGYQATGGCFIYRRSIAKDVWGTDDPVEVSKKIGGGSGSYVCI